MGFAGLSAILQCHCIQCGLWLLESRHWRTHVRQLQRQARPRTLYTLDAARHLSSCDAKPFYQECQHAERTLETRFRVPTCCHSFYTPEIQACSIYHEEVANNSQFSLAEPRKPERLTGFLL